MPRNNRGIGYCACGSNFIGAKLSSTRNTEIYFSRTNTFSIFTCARAYVLRTLAIFYF